MRSLTSEISQDALGKFLDGYMYTGEAVLVDRVLAIDAAAGTIDAELDTDRPLAYAQLQRITEQHPAHVSAGDLLMATGTVSLQI